jgi:hypothetical protein
VKSFAGFAQADTACCADEERCADSRLQRAYRLADRRWSYPEFRAALRKLRCSATLRNASTPSSAPRLTVKFGFIGRAHYSEWRITGSAPSYGLQTRRLADIGAKPFAAALLIARIPGCRSFALTAS